MIVIDMTSGKDTILDPAVVKDIIELRNSGKAFSEIGDILKVKYGLEIKYNTLYSIYQREVENAMIPDENRSVIGKDELIRQLANEKADKIEFILKNIDQIVIAVTEYKDKIIKWLNNLEVDLEQYYLDSKENQQRLTLKQINEIKDSIAKTKELLSSDINDYTRVLDTYFKFLELNKTSEVKINKLDISFLINQEINNIEKAGYMMINVKSEEAKELMKKLEEQGDIFVFKKT